jgi:hypothetical protein
MLITPYLGRTLLSPTRVYALYLHRSTINPVFAVVSFSPGRQSRFRHLQEVILDNFRGDRTPARIPIHAQIAGNIGLFVGRSAGQQSAPPGNSSLL